MLELAFGLSGSSIHVSYWPLSSGVLPFNPGFPCGSGEVNGNPLQYSCLENPMVGGAWWALVHGSQRVGHD